jgi:energy-coupling factor transporter ATP-binding protein EcfA2
MSISDNSLRPEAGPIPYWKHHKRAKEALNFIIRVLKGAADSVEGSKGISGNHTIDTNRASRIFFVSGEPGSGKSTLYLTLKAMINSEEKGKYQAGYKGNDKINLDKDLTGVRWLDALDLEVAGDEGENLLAAVLVRLFRKLEESNPVHSKNCEDAIKELEELATDIGIAWEGNLQARAGALDPDTYSAEVIRTQGARLRINERLKEALNKLAEKECYGCSKGTIFVLPVDDFYLKPAASLQLLRLLRMISIPRLFFLVMGDINTVEALFIEKSLADWTRVAGPGLFMERTERLDDALTRARELRARYLRKLLPPGQRATIEAMDWHEALNFEVGRPKSNVTDVEVLEELLAKVELDRPWNESNVKTTLLTFLISPSLPFLYPLTPEEKLKRERRAKGDDEAKKDDAEKKALKKEIAQRKPRAAYTALQILDATPREMMDLGFALREVIRSREELKLKEEAGETEDNDKTPLLLSSVRDIVNLVREEQNFLNEKKQKVLEGILPTRLYSPDDINFEMDRLCLTPSPRTWKKQREESLKPKELWVRNHRSWDLRVNTDKYLNDSQHKDARSDKNESIEQDTKDPFAKLPPRPAAWFVLLHDLAQKWKPDSITENLVQKLCEELDGWKAESRGNGASPPNQEVASQLKYLSLITTEQNPDPSEEFPGWAIWVDGTNYEHFPMPVFETFRDLDRFLFIWSSGLERLWKHHNEPELDQLFDLWELAGQIILKDLIEDRDAWYKKFAEGGEAWYENFAERLKEIEEEQPVFLNPPPTGNEQDKESQRRLDEWVVEVRKLKKKVLDSQNNSPSSPPQD